MWNSFETEIEYGCMPCWSVGMPSCRRVDEMEEVGMEDGRVLRKGRGVCKRSKRVCFAAAAVVCYGGHLPVGWVVVGG